ncbi:MAG: hypothetical protein C4570_06810 [Ammonifex sp.]|jgi:hypothetical protein|nr:MAG: hypothetical protein C4570_06810 [Ammonifex sp.]
MPVKLSAAKAMEKGRAKPVVKNRRSWMQRLALRLDLSVFDLWVIIGTVAGLGALYLIGEVASILAK